MESEGQTDLTILDIRPSIPEDAHYLAPRLRDADKAEIRALTGGIPEIMLPQCVLFSRATWTMCGFAGEPVGIMGVQDVPENPDVGWGWMLATDIIEKYPFHFLRRSRSLLPVIHTFHPIITNHVDERNTVHIRWLRWLGFSFIRRIERWGAESRPFIEFARLQPKCV